MTRCFKDLDCDTQTLNGNTQPIAGCETLNINLYDCDVDVIEVPILTCEGLWRIFQREAEEIVAPGGTLIADPIERNRAINAAYARLWLHDSRFQWAGLAAFASKQVGCGLLHAAQMNELIQAERDAIQPLRDSRSESGLLTPARMEEQAQLAKEADKMDAANPSPDWLPKAAVQDQIQYVYEMMALGNTTLFLDIYPLHMFYAKRGFEEFKTCLNRRSSIYGHPKFPVLWLVEQRELAFGEYQFKVLLGFDAIERGEVAESVGHLAWHEQQNILQPSMYNKPKLAWSLRSNHLAYVTNLPSGLSQAIELTLANQCPALQDGRTIGFVDNPLADLSNLDERMRFVLRAADRFDELLKGPTRDVLAQSISDIAAGLTIE